MRSAVAILPKALLAALLGCVTALGQSTSGRAASPNLVFIPVLAGDENGVGGPLALSADGSTVVGLNGSLINSGSPYRAWRWTRSTGTVALGTVIGFDQANLATAVSGDGSLVAGSGIGSSGAQGFTWTPSGGIAPLGFGNEVVVNMVQGVSADGSTVVGGQATSSADGAFYWTQAGGFVGIGTVTGDNSAYATAVSATGAVIAGASSNSSTGTTQAFIWTAGGAMVGLGALPGDTGSIANAVSGDGSTVVGTSWNGTTGSTHAFRWTAGTGMVNLGTLNGDTSAIAYATNQDGSIVVGQSSGNVADEPGGSAAFIWTQAGGMQYFEDYWLLAGGYIPGGAVEFLSATGVSADGTVFLIQGSNTLGAFAPFIASLHQPNSHDFNGDGMSDILFRNASAGGTVALWQMNGGSVSQSAGISTLPSSFSIIGQHDFNGDGKADMLWRDSSGNVSMWFMNGTAVSSAAAVGNLTGNWTLYGTTDLNGDGKGDLLWRDANTGTVAVWFMSGATVASTAVFGAVASNWAILGDTNGEISVARHRRRRRAVGRTERPGDELDVLGTVTSNFVVQGGGDFDGDGKVDILWRDTNSGALSIWFTNGTQVTSGASVGRLPSNWSVVQVGDFNGDGKSDILLLDSAGDVAVWLMNGATVSSSIGIGNVGTAWQVQNVNAN